MEREPGARAQVKREQGAQWVDVEPRIVTADSAL